MRKYKSFNLILAAVLLVGSLNFAGTTASAAEYKGKGSKSDPYIVTTAEQLDGIRNNLKAHYKLGNTIDLSGVANFKPIGNLSEPFTGSLSCDLDDSGKPKYAIKNLKINIAPAGSTLAEKFSGYKEKKSGWEAGLFGYAQGATFKNVLVLDATVTSTVQGCYQMNSDFSVNPGTNEQGAAILIALGQKVTISGCGVSGTVTSASNHVGGMVGKITNSKISKSYSYATVTSTGAWGSGGLLGSMSESSSVSTSFYSGVFSGGKTHAGAFAGSVYGTQEDCVVDCWASGTVKTSDSGCFLGTKNHSDSSTLESKDVAKNCYTLAVIEGRKNAQTNKRVTDNNYITDAPGGLEMGFAAASQAEINAVYQALPNWTVADGSYPQIKGLVAVSDSTAYVVQEITEDTTTGTEQTGEEAKTDADSTETTGEEEKPDADSTEMTEKEAEIKVQTVFQNTFTSLQGVEFVLVILLSVLVALSMIGAIVVILMTIRSHRSVQRKEKQKWIH